MVFLLQPSRCVNQIEEVCRTIEKTINQTVQNTLNSLEKDCELISEAITDTLYNDRYIVYLSNIGYIFTLFFAVLHICNHLIPLEMTLIMLQ